MATERNCTLPGRLRQVDDRSPGITRLRRGRGFVYRDADGHRVTDSTELRRIRALAIPPAYERVWICPRPDGHLQATGIDARGRKQYRYHVRWRQERESTKFERLAGFGAALARIRARVSRDLAAADGPVPTRRHVLATIVRLLDTTLARIGNDEYARENGSFGLTTLRNRHVDVNGSRIQLRFRGKSGVLHELEVDDPHVATIVRECLAVPGRELFRYLDEAGAAHAVGSVDVNDYLRDAANAQITAKDFRTWHASVLAFALARACSAVPTASKRQRRSEARRVLAQVALQLGNTVAVCRKSYVHPSVIELLVDPHTTGELPAGRRRPRLRKDECAFLAFLAAADRRDPP